VIPQVALLFLLAQDVKPLSELSTNYLTSPILSPSGKLLFRDESGIEWRPFAGGPGKTIVSGEEDNKGGWLSLFALAPNEKTIAFLRDYCIHCNARLFIKDLGDNSEREISETCLIRPVWTPDGRFIIAAEATGEEARDSSSLCRIAAFPANGGTPIRLTSEGKALALSSDGAQLAFSIHNRLMLEKLNSDLSISGAPVVLAEEPHSISSIFFGPGDRSILYQVYASGDWYTRRLSLDSKSSAELVPMERSIEITQLLANGDALGVEELERRYLMRESSQEKIPIPWGGTEADISADGKSIAFVTTRNGPPQIWRSNPDGSGVKIVLDAIPSFYEPGDNTRVVRLRWSPDGKWLALLTGPGVGYGVSNAILYLISSGGGHLHTVVDDCDDNTLAWSADSKSIFFDTQAHEEEPTLEYTHHKININTRVQIVVKSPGGVPNSHRLESDRLTTRLVYITGFGK
jgi:Tol biopolymer transport system component